MNHATSCSSPSPDRQRCCLRLAQDFLQFALNAPWHQDAPGLHSKHLKLMNHHLIRMMPGQMKMGRCILMMKMQNHQSWSHKMLAWLLSLKMVRHKMKKHWTQQEQPEVSHKNQKTEMKSQMTRMKLVVLVRKV